jgi:2-polyprenyl-3-methyl-5-hydroxy-6-metoxy-1,4-benzoquinol methylase
MYNLIKEKPTDTLHGRALYNTLFVQENDIKNKKILDIGCGFGWFELNAILRECENVIGIEIAEEDLLTVRKYIKDSRVDFKVGSAIKLPFENNKFDTIVSWEVIEHIPKNTENKMFSEVNRVLKNNGVFYLSTPFNSFFSNIFDPAWWLIGHRHYKKNDLINFAESNGFKIEKIILNGGIWEILGINNLYIAKWIFRRTPFFEKFFNEKQDKEYKKQKGFTNIFIKFKKI